MRRPFGSPRSPSSSPPPPLPGSRGHGLPQVRGCPATSGASPASPLHADASPRCSRPPSTSSPKPTTASQARNASDLLNPSPDSFFLHRRSHISPLSSILREGAELRQELEADGVVVGRRRLRERQHQWLLQVRHRRRRRNPQPLLHRREALRVDRKSTRLNSSHRSLSRMPSSA